MILRYLIFLLIIKFTYVHSNATTEYSQDVNRIENITSIKYEELLNDTSVTNVTKRASKNSKDKEDDDPRIENSSATTDSSKDDTKEESRTENDDRTGTETEDPNVTEKEDRSKQEDPEVDPKSYKLMQPYLKDDFNTSDIFIHLEPEVVAFRPDGTRCSKKNLSCTICLAISFDNFATGKQRLCVEISFKATDFKLNFLITMDGSTILNQGVSGKNPPKICFPIRGATVCIRISDIYFPGRNVHLCADLELKYKRFQALDIHLNCFKFGRDRFKYMPPGEKAPAKPIF